MLPTRLRAPAPGWHTETDVVIVGSGIAGLTTALQIARQSSLRVLLVTKDVLAAGSTRWAQGGIAAALGVGDSPRSTSPTRSSPAPGSVTRPQCGCSCARARPRCATWPPMGARFDRARDGQLSLTREGGHRRDRIAHAGGDATGAEIERALEARVLVRVRCRRHRARARPRPAPRCGRCGRGVTLHVMGEGQRDGVGAVRARAVVLATGGLGQVYTSTTNPAVSTGDGVAAALRAGAVVRDLEFVQFHPTVAWLGARSRGQQPLVSEAVRGEGAFLVDDAGIRFMTGQHELADLAPRDVVAKAILRRMRETGAEHVWLDGRAFGAEKWRVRFPTIYATLTSLGHRPGARSDPGGAGLPLRIGRGSHRPGWAIHGAEAVRVRGGGLHRRARREPTGVQLAAGGTGVRPTDRVRARSRSWRAGNDRGAGRSGGRVRRGRRLGALAPTADHVVTRRRASRPSGSRCGDGRARGANRPHCGQRCHRGLGDDATCSRWQPR